jgi:hypothetical protein
MTGADAHWWLNFATLAGIAILAVPVWSLNLRKKKLQEIRQSLPAEPLTFKHRVRSILSDKRNRDVADWRRLDEICLIVGYLFLLGSALLRLFVPVTP